MNKVGLYCVLIPVVSVVVGLLQWIDPKRMIAQKLHSVGVQERR